MSLADVFRHPSAWPVLLAVPVVWWWLRGLERRQRRRRTAWTGPRRASLVPTAPTDASKGRRRVVFAVAILLALVAALGPLAHGTEGRLAWRGVDVVVCLDVSRSMTATDLAPDRLGRAQHEIRALAERAGGDRFALVVFAGEARGLVPLTSDARSFAELASLAHPTSVGRGGTDLGAALDAAREALPGGRDRPAAILLITDGEDLGGRGRAAADRCRERGVPVHAVGLGSVAGTPIALPGGREVVSALDEPGLRAIADATGGSYVDASAHASPLVGLYEDRLLPLASATPIPGEGGQRKNAYQVPLLLAFLLLVIDLGIGRGARARAPRAALSLRRAAALLPLLLLAGCDATQEGREAYAAGRNEEALRHFDAAIERAGADASLPLLYDRTLALLRLERWADAEVAARHAETRGGAAFAGLAAFARGSAAFARSHALDAEARRPGGDTEAAMGALKLAEDALAGWQWAAASRRDWPEARRNAERAFLWLSALRERRGDGTRPPSDTPKPPPPPPPPPPTPPERNPDTAPESRALPPGRVLGVLDLLRGKEREKLDVRRAEQRTRTGTGGRDY